MKLPPELAKSPNLAGLAFIRPLKDGDVRSRDNKSKLVGIKQCRVRSDAEFEEVSRQLFAAVR